MPNDWNAARRCSRSSVTAVVRPNLEVGREQRTQVVAELDIGRRHVVEGADRHRQHAVGDVSAFLRYALRRQAVFHVAAEGHEASAVDREERVQHGSDEHLAAPVRLLKFFPVENVLRGLERDRTPQRHPVHARERFSELLSQAEQDAVLQGF